MNLKEQLSEKKSALLALKERIEQGEADAIKEGEELTASIDTLEKQIEEAKKASDLLARISDSEVEEKDIEMDNVLAKTIGAHAVKELGDHMAKGEKFSVRSTEFKANTTVVDTPSAIAGALTTFDENIVTGVRRRLTIADLLGTETIQGTALTYYVEGTVEGSVATVAEGAKKPQISLTDPTPVTESLKKIAAYYKETDEIIEDAGWLESSLNGRLVYLLQAFEEDQLLNGNGTGTNLTGILNRSGILTETATSATLADKILKAIGDVENSSPFTADGIVINPADYYALRISKDSNGQYFGGGFFEGQYGANGIVEKPSIWGLRTVVTPAIAQGTVLVGAFAQGGSVIRKGGLTVEMTNTNEDDFVYNRVTILGEERIALAVRYPSAFDKITISE